MQQALTSPDPNLNGYDIVTVRLRSGVDQAAALTSLKRIAATTSSIVGFRSELRRRYVHGLAGPAARRDRQLQDHGGHTRHPRLWALPRARSWHWPSPLSPRCANGGETLRCSRPSASFSVKSPLSCRGRHRWRLSSGSSWVCPSESSSDEFCGALLHTRSMPFRGRPFPFCRSSSRQSAPWSSQTSSPICRDELPRGRRPLPCCVLNNRDTHRLRPSVTPLAGAP